MNRCDIAVVGAGPGGLAAAIEAARYGASVQVLDENSALGGQIYRSLSGKGPKLLSAAHRSRAQWLVRNLERFGEKIEIKKEAVVWGGFDQHTLAYTQAEESRTMTYEKLVLATGAYDRPMIFPGWTLPGVFTAGGAQRMLKDHGILPGSRILLAGSGPLQLALAKQIVDAGGEIAGILEAGSLAAGPGLLSGLARNPELISEAAQYLATIFKAGVRIRPRRIIVAARGDGRVEEAGIARVDDQWRPRKGGIEWVPVDAVCLGYGLLPSNEIARHLGAAAEYTPQFDTFVLERNPGMKTSVKDVFAVGDGVVQSGSHAAWLEGRIAGIQAAADLGFINSNDADRTMIPIRLRLTKVLKLQRAMREYCRPGPGFYELAEPSTLVCRCEEITMGELMGRIQSGVSDIRQLKRFTRAGMGACQGRICGSFINHILRKHVPKYKMDLLPPRPPVKPVMLKTTESLQ